MLSIGRNASSAAGRAKVSVILSSRSRSLATAVERGDKVKFVVVGGGSGGISVANQIYDRFKAAGTPLKEGDVAIVDGSANHYYQPGWTLVAAGLRPKTDFERPLDTMIPKHITHIKEHVASFSPAKSSLKTTTGREISYDALIVAAGLQINWKNIQGLEKALQTPGSGVSSIYSYDTCDKMWGLLNGLKSGKAVFTQPAGVIKCPGAPQKIMWMAWDRFRRTGRNVSVDFYNGMPTMFSVKKYSDALEKLRVERSIGGHFQHNLVSVNSDNHTATFKKADGSTVETNYDLLHVVPPMGPLDFLKSSPLADKDGWVDVDNATLQHNNPEFSNVFSLGDCSSLPTSRTAAAITSQAPVLTENLYSLVSTGKVGNATYDGYTSCPLLTGYGELMLAEFKYGFVPKESFGNIVDQGKSNRAFYHLSKDFFPFAYWKYMVKGKWFGAKGLSKPVFN